MRARFLVAASATPIPAPCASTPKITVPADLEKRYVPSQIPQNFQSNKHKKFQLLDDIIIDNPAPKVSRVSRVVENTPLPPLESIMRPTETYSPCAVSDYMDNYSVMDTLHAGT